MAGAAIQKGSSLQAAVSSLQSYFQGTWGLVAVTTREPDRIVATTHGSPLLIGVGPEIIHSDTAHTYTHTHIHTRRLEYTNVSHRFFSGVGCMFIASEASAFSKYTNEFIVLRDDEVRNGEKLDPIF